MRHRLLGGSGLRVSELCLGTLTFGERKDWGADAEASRAILTRFADAGGTFIDTAPNYADSAAEEIVGAFVAGRRDDFVLATKFTASVNRHPLAGGNSRKAMLRSVEASLKRLGTDHIDLLWLHFWDGTTPIEEIARGFDDLVRSGKVLYTGFSDTPAWLASRAATMAELRGWVKPAAIQFEYNLAARTPERELVPMAEAMDLGRVCWGPLAAGALAGGERTRLAKMPPKLAETSAALSAIAAETGLTPIVLALGWLIARGCIPLIGARQPEQLDAALSLAPIDAAILARLDAIAPMDPGFPHALINSSYLRRFALGDPERLLPPARARC
ncbi:aryl-alcohol dehydrogenase-like predicted oxidoreductase [Sphingomonas vulcanisoli]|uniref:Aryl-alcohol dehydrogenase-like predicted oxidoreductase n=1 Tax=Sphingomonas vulcanisoli TaxID=1658060 RepID=A0ABX0TUQ5_9SPHN|nr:aldo/keto reductase [Sphingomonas vulcanisoli]NIJ09263.1 aryl-alcohol dehydrogenase-like predicted oxidoreductase [Sphingomonas vulcanisoli]